MKKCILCRSNTCRYVGNSEQNTAFKAEDHIQTTVSEITDNGVIAKDKNGKTFEIKGDSVILSVGYKPAPLANKSKHVHVIGDASNVGNLRTVIWGAWDVCMKL